MDFFLFSASLGALSPANHPQMPSNPYLRPGANFPAPPFYHPAMPQMMGRVPPGAPLMLPSTSQTHNLLQPQPPSQKPETQVCNTLIIILFLITILLANINSSILQ